MLGPEAWLAPGETLEAFGRHAISVASRHRVRRAPVHRTLLTFIAWAVLFSVLACGPSDPAHQPSTGIESEAQAVELDMLPELPSIEIDQEEGTQANRWAEAPPPSEEILDWSDSESAIEAIDEISMRGDSESLIQLEEILAISLDEEVRLEVIDALAFMSEDQDVSAIVQQGLNDPSPLVRIESADLAAEMLMIEILPALKRRAAVESDPEAQIFLDDVIDELDELRQAH